MNINPEHTSITRIYRQQTSINPPGIASKIPHRSCVSAPRIQKISRKDLHKSLKIQLSTISTISQYNNKSRKHQNLVEPLKTKTTPLTTTINDQSSFTNLPLDESLETAETSTADLSKRTDSVKQQNAKQNQIRQNNHGKRICCRCSPIYFLLLPLALILLGAAIAAITMSLIKITTTITTTIATATTNSTTSETTTTSRTTSTTSKTTTTSTTTKTTTTSVTTTTTINCVSPYARTPSQTCVNTMIDFSNCGAVGHVCAATYRSCSAGICSTAPGIELDNPNSIVSSAINGAIDDDMYNVHLPMNVSLYGITTDVVTVTSNGVLCFSGCNTTYTETALPTTAFSGVTVLPYWDDLYVFASTSQGIYYGIEGNSTNRSLIFEYYMSHYGQSSQYYHFQVIFFEAVPGIVQMKYFDASDGGITCTVGVQRSSSGPFIQYSFDRANSVRSNMTLTFDTIHGSYTNSTSG